MPSQQRAPGAPWSQIVKARYATSCTECRRRKQKCNQGRPCNNCCRRFPQPTCEYRTEVKRSTFASREDPNVKVVLEGGAYAHLDLGEVQDAILQIEGVDLNDIGGVKQLTQAHGKPGAKGTHGLSEEDLAAIRAVASEESGALDPKAVHAMVLIIFRARLEVADRIICDEMARDRGELLRAAMLGAGPAAMVGGLDDQLRNLPMEPTRMNIEFVRIHLQLLSRFKASIDGRPDPGNRFMKHWVPLSIQDPLLLRIILYTAACFLNETGRLPKALVWGYKGMVHKMLNEHLRCPLRQARDPAIMSTAQMVMDSWYWGTTEELRAHMAGLKSMVKMRGGPQFLGMQGFLAKTVLTHDIVIALAHEREPDMYGRPGFAFQDLFMVPYQTTFNSPFMMDWPPFHSPASTLRIHPLSAAILDDMRAVLAVVLSLPSKPTAEELRNVEATASWYSDRLDQMPDDVTMSQFQAQNAHFDGSNSSTASFSEEGSPRDEASFSDYSGSSPRSIGPPIDIMYRCIRITASVYYRAILSRVPTSTVLSAPESLHIWTMVWEVTLATWKTAVGVFLWVLVAVVPSCHETPAARFVKTSMVTGFMTMGVENWHVGIDLAESALRLQRWLRGGRDVGLRGYDDSEETDAAGARGGGLIGGERIIEKHGYLFRDQLPECAIWGPGEADDDD